MTSASFNEFNRRRFLSLAVASTATLLLQPWRWFLSLFGNGTALRPHPLLSTFSDPRSAAFIGKAYLEGRHTEAHAWELAKGLEEALKLYPNDSRQPDALRAAMQARQRDDFANGRTVNVAGWMLSQTEARLCALAFLHYGRHPIL